MKRAVRGRSRTQPVAARGSRSASASADGLFSHILCPLDFEHESIEALLLARRIAEQNGAEIHMLYMAPLPMGAAETSPVPLDPFPYWEQEGRRRLEEIGRDQLSGRVRYSVEVMSGDAATGILSEIDRLGIDLVVMGTHGRKGVKHFFLGSVAEKIVRESTRPVLTVRPSPPKAKTKSGRRTSASRKLKSQ